MKKFILSAGTFAICLSTFIIPQTAFASQDIGTLHYYPVPKEDRMHNGNNWRVFLEYNLHREQCQHYQPLPKGYEFHGCDIYSISDPRPREEAARDPISSYTVYFNLDRADISRYAQEKIDEAVNEIKDNNPGKIYVSGYAGRSGTDKHNMTLSQKRADMVVEHLIAGGINENRIATRAYGETNLAVDTKDGVRMPLNRRVVISFERG